ncbi:ATP-binding cassette domain-containing protein [Corynebacterium glucuronolyticum]|uniref:ATP-binding cassette domain-containing protein n=2 Tax=Corynebacterium glucuronolyticum TaxID=39791 RepID=A0AAX1L7L6_9CORY|nr:ATP-binding cassette domain-containing protein [Corynebacterium glucuronolyticum]QRP70411.1 ATP-binding cassette domain-containing protein [Corynebacterium glucuronolyticum]
MSWNRNPSVRSGEPVPWTFGLDKGAVTWLIVSWGASLLQGTLMVFPAKGMELALNGYEHGNLDPEDVALFILFIATGPITLFASRVATAKANVVHLRAIFSKSLLAFSERGFVHPDPDKIQSRLMNEGGALVETWRGLPNTMIASAAAFASAFILLDEMTISALVIIGMTSFGAILSSKGLAGISSSAWRENMNSLADFSKAMRQRFVPDFADVVEAAAVENWANTFTQRKGDTYFRTSIRQTIFSSFSTFLPTLINQLAPALILLWYLFIERGSEVSSVVGVMTFAAVIARPISDLGSCFDIVKRGTVARKSLGNLFQRKDAKMIVTCAETQLLSDGVVQLVGPSGSGKSTFLKSLILGSKRKIDGPVGYCPQSNAFLNGTLEENVVMGRNISAAEVENVLDSLGLISEFQNRGGAQAVLDGSGSDISGGQARRLSIARAVVGSPAVIALDEPLNGLDENNIRRAKDLIRSKLDQRLLIEISHQVGVVDEADQLIEVKVKL